MTDFVFEEINREFISRKYGLSGDRYESWLRSSDTHVSSIRDDDHRLSGLFPSSFSGLFPSPYFFRERVESVLFRDLHGNHEVIHIEGRETCLFEGFYLFRCPEGL